MDALTLEQFDRQAAEFDATVAATPDIDHFCSSTDWIMPAARALMPPREPWLFRGAHGQVALMRSRHPEGWRYAEPLEAMWGLACPLVGPDSARLAAEFFELCRQRRRAWDVLLLSGLPVGSRLLAEVGQRMASRYEVLQGQTTTRLVASLAGGVDGFLARRSRNFRKALRRALRASEAAGLVYETCHDTGPEHAEALYQRIVAIERQSWKGREGGGITAGGMYGFYRDMVRRMTRRGGLRILFARHEDRDIGYVLGGVFGSTYRGLQFSYHDDYADYSLGNLCQYYQIVDLCQAGILDYDLGTDMDYKRRWAEDRRDSMALIVVKR